MGPSQDMVSDERFLAGPAAMEDILVPWRNWMGKLWETAWSEHLLKKGLKATYFFGQQNGGIEATFDEILRFIPHLPGEGC